MDKFKEKLEAFRAKINGKDPNAPEEPKFSENKTFEINLVPEIKYQMLKSMRFRKVSTFVCIIVAAVFGVATAIFGGIVLTENATMASQDTKLDSMAKKINEFGSMDDFLTLQNQLNAIQTVNDNKKVLSRIFGVLSMLRPQGGDEVTMSKVSINMEENTVSIEGQANAGVAPFYDYRVLESFKKGAELTKYDYGRYVDEDGEEIPSRCMIEARKNGTTYIEADGSIYAYQTIGKYGCDAKIKALKDALTDIDERESVSTENETKTEIDESGKEITTTVTTRTRESELRAQQAQVYSEYGVDVRKNWFDKWLKQNNLERYDDLTSRQSEIEAAFRTYYEGLTDDEKAIVDTELEDGVDIKDVDFRKIYRTPQFTEWIKEGWVDEEGQTQGEARMTLSGSISNWPHFESRCITYSGEETEQNGKSVVVWTTENNCMLLASEMNITESSNGKDSSGELVLRFKATVTFEDTVLSFQNKHVLAIGPDGQNVTDSYRQIEGMFEQQAADCNSPGVICTESEVQGNSGSTNTNDNTNASTREEVKES